MDKFTASLLLAIVRTYTTRLRLLSSYLRDTTLAADDQLDSHRHPAEIVFAGLL